VCRSLTIKLRMHQNCRLRASLDSKALALLFTSRQVRFEATALLYSLAAFDVRLWGVEGLARTLGPRYSGLVSELVMDERMVDTLRMVMPLDGTAGLGGRRVCVCMMVCGRLGDLMRR
jgi:hypothetical protein